MSSAVTPNPADGWGDEKQAKQPDNAQTQNEESGNDHESRLTRVERILKHMMDRAGFTDDDARIDGPAPAAKKNAKKPQR